MLSFDMKNKLNTLRDILVGKVPDPKSQVEQITIAMVFKFMDDMDKEFIEDEFFGGERKFFVDTEKVKYSKYAWSNIMNPQVSGQERADLYREGIEAMQRNPNLPDFFRDVFRNAYIPFRDAETINLFLKEINDFTYNSQNSEDLGEAFEMLLSIMSSQGDAGQFRTPRHIIDMIVEIVQPTKNDRILDPACGTAGFLISAYKYILNHNLDNDGHISLTPDEKKKMMQSFEGYDISQDMVRLSRVNMYLHHFSKPRIFEYDTLTSLDRWDEQFDVVFANPPFMTPKGGINPHNRFRVQAKRSEILFVDYIAEHLSPNGRAGIIVPEGVVFQSANAYKELRKYLVDEGLLYAVISLPAGIFNPYSSVKTSVLLIDKALAKQKNDVLFVKMNSDGFDLGAQRREIKSNDIPYIIDIIKAYQNNEEISDNALVQLADKQKIAEQDYILVGERYKEVEEICSEYPLIRIEDLINNVKYSEKVLKSDFKAKGKYPIIDQSELFIAGYCNDENKLFHLNKPVICFGDHTRTLKYVDFDFVLGADGVKILEPNNSILTKYMFYCLRNIQIKNLGYSRHFKLLKEIQIPIPPLSVQEQIVAEIESYQKIIDGAKQIVTNYKPTIKVDPTWNKIKLGEVCTLATGATPSSFNEENYKNGSIRWLVSGDINMGVIYDCCGRVTKKGAESARLKMHPVNSVMIALNGQGKTRGMVALLKTAATCNQSLVSINAIDTKTLMQEFIFVVLKGMYQQIRNITGDNQRSGLNMPILRQILIPIPSIEIQKQIVAEINEEMAIVEQNKRLIEIFEQKITDKISEVWSANENKSKVIPFQAQEPELKYAARNCTDKFLDAVKNQEDGDSDE